MNIRTKAVWMPYGECFRIDPEEVFLGAESRFLERLDSWHESSRFNIYLDFSKRTPNLIFLL